MQKELRGTWNGTHLEEPHLIKQRPNGKIVKMHHVNLLTWMAPFKYRRVKITVETL